MLDKSEIMRLLDVAEGDIRVAGSPLWLDPRRKRELAFVSHAHSDHTARHRKVIVSRNCLPLYIERTGHAEAEAYDFGTPFKVEGIQVTLLPAGHILGSAQILVERDGLSLLYSGDFKLRPCATAEKIEVRHADILVVESTYGLPHYRFPAREEIIAQLKQFLEETVAAQKTPVLLAYSLGKAQETMRIVSDLGYEPWVHETIYRIAKIYEQQGVALGRYHRLTLAGWKSPARRRSRPRVVIVPPHLRNTGVMSIVGPRRVAFLSGFALDQRTRYIYKADACIPLSDHADFSEWIEYIRRVNPQVVLTTHGPDEARAHLVKEGFRALPLKPSRQGFLFEGL
jgi:Cft2 family RNA processing exonuclease